MLKIFRRRKVEEEVGIIDDNDSKFEINYEQDPEFSIAKMPLYKPGYYGRKVYSEILNDLQEYTQSYGNLFECMDELLKQHYLVNQLFETICVHVGKFEVKNRKYIRQLIQNCFSTYSQNRDDAIKIIEDYYEVRNATNKEEIREEFRKQTEDLVADNNKIIESLKGFLTAFGKYLSSGDERFTPEHFMDMSAVRRLDQFSKLLEGISSANEATMQELIARLTETPTSASDNSWQERLENVPKIVLDPEASTTPTADGF